MTSLWVCLFSHVLALTSAHVLNYDSVTICDGMMKQIKCPRNENIHVLQGFYGKWRNHDCKGQHLDPDNLPTCSEDRRKTTAIARNICQGKNTCKLAADKSIYGQPCPENRAYLYVTFFCLAPGYKLKHEKSSSNEEVVTVPSHGFIVQEAKHNLKTEEDKKKKEDIANKKIILPPGNPTPGVYKEEKVEVKSKSLISNESTPESFELVEGEASQKSQLPNLEDIKRKETEEKGIRGSTICNGQSKLIACLPEEGIKVHYAFYGKKTGKDCKGDLPYKDESPTCSALDAKSNVENSCNGKQTCLLFADDNIYGKSLCPNVNKYLYLKYSCIQMPTDLPSMPVKLTPQEDLEEDAVSRSTTPEKQNTTVKICNGDRRTISCERNVGVQILSAFYGKENGKDCRGDLGYRDDIPECSNPRAMDSVKFLCESRKSCDLAAENELFGDDVCPGVNKYLKVIYSC